MRFRNMANASATPSGNPCRGSFLKPLQKRYRMHRNHPAILVRDHGREKVKAKTEAVHRQFHKLRFMAKIRCNQAHRLYEAARAAIQAGRSGNAF